MEPYYGAFGEAFDLGLGEVTCVSLWHTQLENAYSGQPTDVYVWSGGVFEEPGAVLAVETGVVFPEMPIWPEFGRFDVEISAVVSGGFTVGSWGDWPGEPNGYFWLVDYEGPGRPWTHVHWESGWPDGWQHPEIVWGLPIESMGLGVHFLPADPVPTATRSWGTLKSLFY